MKDLNQKDDFIQSQARTYFLRLLTRLRMNYLQRLDKIRNKTP
ncbi:hypothetical protein HMPREF3187_00655 [Aerococcus christensenii]|uniref:Uncharacterized protein n=1 Tax=Aerococcus christensenii TaxID=87541 RepID=A0A133Y205_9LACT|nr:hypothetical protein HMPREF3187_00655 [Aerococcus christensenii]